MIKNLIFDFGDVFINLDKKGALFNALKSFGIKKFSNEMHAINARYEQGHITTDEFIAFYLENFQNLNSVAFVNLWNSILQDFPRKRLMFIKKLAKEKKYKLILLSNTNELHINWIKENLGFYEEFKSYFHKFYLSHEIRLRKPEPNIYEFVLNENNLKAQETLFIDDTEENINSAHTLGIHTWHLNPKTDDITELFSIKSNLF